MNDENVKTVKLTSEKTVNDVKSKINQDAIDKLEKEINKLSEEIKEKVYIVTSDKTIGTALDYFIRNEAQWEFNEVLGVIELSKQIDDFVQGKEKQLSLDSTGVQALYYFLSKKTGKGLDSALSYYNTLLKPVSDAVQRIENDKKELEELEFRKISLEQGVDPDDPMKTLNDEK